MTFTTQVDDYDGAMFSIGVASLELFTTDGPIHPWLLARLVTVNTASRFLR